MSDKNGWQVAIRPPSFNVQVKIRAGDVLAQCPLPQPIPSERVVVKYIYPALQQEVTVKTNVSDTKIEFSLPIAVTFDVDLIALVFIYEPEEIEVIKKYALEVAEEFKKKEIKINPKLLCD